MPSLASNFGIGFYGHFLAAKTAAEAVDSHFLLLESPYDNVRSMNTSTNSEAGNESSTLHLRTNQLIPGMLTPAVYSTTRRFSVPNGLQLEMVQSLIPCLDSLLSRSMSDSVVFQDQEDMPRCNYQVPAFARSFYSLFVELHQIFISLPAIGKALSSVQKMLVDVNEGKQADTQTLSEAQNFRLTIEGLRIALNKAARRPFDELNSNSCPVHFCDLPNEEKCHVLFAQALKSQAGKFGTVVAVVDAASLAGLRRHWKTCVPPEVAELANHCFTHFCDEDLDSDDEIINNNVDKKKILTDKPVVALGAGATAVFGVSSLSKAIPASSLIKVATFHLPASVKVGLMQLQRTAAVVLSKMLVPSKLLAPGLTAGAKSSTLTLTASAEKIRAVTHGLVTTAERTSLLAIRTSFYEIMRRRHVRPVRFVPWASFACSMGACTGLLMYGDGIECAAESFPSVPMIASLGRGLQSLQLASQEVKRTSSAKLHEALHTLVQYVKRS
ncbi:hypothetical protein HPP92_007378 [Vanilla planifolia]|uniref:Uncharacterized protein n=1 Tax=Vanilla planifolia TaxID=51239 RepID=A0A835RLP1_VANPL|nr:hypothetical protein HPP92_007378 [Vanilla planifolia]